MAISKKYTVDQVVEYIHRTIQQQNDVKERVDSMNAWQAPWTNDDLTAQMSGAVAGDGLIVKTAIAALKAITDDFSLANAALDEFGGFKA